MAKSPTKAVKATPKPAGKSTAKANVKAPGVKSAKAAAKPAIKLSTTAPVAEAAQPAKTSQAKSPAKKPTKTTLVAAKGKVKKRKERSSTISQLASDILADRIMPTIEQIKSIAASALGHNPTKDNKTKVKKKKK